MNRYKICVYAICKNEEKFVDRWMDSVSEADLVVVLDTGSDDKTVEKLKGRGAVVYEKKIIPWRFDEARNIAMRHIPEDVDICVSNDLDEIFKPGWREKIESFWKPHHTRAKYMFTWSYKEDGTEDKQFVMEKIHRRHGFKWVHPVHEILEYSGTDEDTSVFIPDLVLNHYPDPLKPRTQYLSLLELSAKENPKDDRVIFWLGREYMYCNKYDKGIQTLTRHLSLSSATWEEERCASMRFISKCYEAKRNFQQAQKWLYKAIAECPYVREPYMDMAQLGYKINDWTLVYAMVTNGLKIYNKTGSYLLDPKAWGADLYDLGAISCYNIGLFDESYRYALKAFELEPNNKRLENNLKIIKDKI